MSETKNSFIIVLLLVAATCCGQERLGLTLSNYGGPHAILLNPSSNVGAPIYWQANLVSIGFFGENNYGYISNATFPRIIKNADNIGPSEQVDSEGGSSQFALTYDFFDHGRDKFIAVNADVMGPAVSIHRSRFAFGIYTRSRALVSIKDVPAVLNFYNLQDLDDGQVLNVNSGSVGAMAWSELGLNFSHLAVERAMHSLSIGGTLKILQGYEANYFTAGSDQVIVNYEDYMDFLNLDVDAGYATNFENDDAFRVLGHGVAADIGFTYRQASKVEALPYRWKAGFSIRDFGFIQFNKNAEAHVFRTTDSVSISKSIFNGADDRNDLLNALSATVYTDPLASLSQERFTMWMPLSVSIQAEYAFTKNILLNALMVRDIPLPIPGVRAENVWAITPRYETRWFEVHLPMILYNDRDFRFGASVKLAYLTVGSDNLNSFLVNERETGTDFYIALKLSPHDLFNRRENNASEFSRKGRRSKNSRCYGF